MAEVLIKKIEILVVEDSTADAMAIQLFLESKDFHVTDMGDGKEALSLVM